MNATLGVDTECHQVARAVAGDRVAFGELAEKHRALVFRCVLAFTTDPRTAEDLVQDVFLHVFCNIGRVDPSRPFAPWLTVVANNFLKNTMRKRRVNCVSMTADGFDAADPSAELCATLHRTVAIEVVRTAIKRANLNERAQHVLFLSVEGFSLTEIAAQLDMNVNTCKAIHKRALERLRPWIAAGQGGATADRPLRDDVDDRRRSLDQWVAPPYCYSDDEFLNTLMRRLDRMGAAARSWAPASPRRGVHQLGRHLARRAKAQVHRACRSRR